MPVMERDPDAAEDLVAWWDYDEGLSPDTEVIVEDDEVVVFWKDGPLLELGPGEHLLTPEDHPALAPYISDDEAPALQVAFVRTSNSPVQFYGPIGDVRDAETGLAVGLVARCETMDLRVRDAAAVIRQVLLLDREGALETWVADEALKVARNVIAANPPPARDVAMAEDGLEWDIADTVQERTNAFLRLASGLSVELETVVLVSMKEEDAQTVKKYLGL
jgi:hypothetical protein